MRIEARAQLSSLAHIEDLRHIEDLPASAFCYAKDYVNGRYIVKNGRRKGHTFKRQPADGNCHRSRTHFISPERSRSSHPKFRQDNTEGPKTTAAQYAAPNF